MMHHAWELTRQHQAIALMVGSRLELERIRRNIIDHYGEGCARRIMFLAASPQRWEQINLETMQFVLKGWTAIPVVIDHNALEQRFAALYRAMCMYDAPLAPTPQ